MRKHEIAFDFTGLVVTAGVFLVNRLVGKEASPFPSGVSIGDAFHVPFAQPLRCFRHVVRAGDKTAVGLEPIRRITAVSCKQYGRAIFEGCRNNVRLRTLHLQQITDGASNKIHRRSAAAFAANGRLQRIINHIDESPQQRIPPGIADDSRMTGMTS